MSFLVRSVFSVCLLFIIYSNPVISLNLLEALQNDPQAAQFLAYVSSTGQSNLLTDPGSVTVFVPTNASLMAFGSSITDPATFVKRHIYSFLSVGRNQLPIVGTTSNRAKLGSPLTNYEDVGFGTPIFITDGELYWSFRNSPAGHFINQAFIISADKVASNGVYHIISSPLQPTSGKTLKSYLETAPNNPPITQFAKMWSTAIQAAPRPLSDYYNGARNTYFTVFVPIDSAWNNLPASMVNTIFNNPSNNYTLLYQILDMHLVPYQIVFPEWTNASGTPSPIKISPGSSNANTATIEADGNNYYVVFGNTRATILPNHNIQLTNGFLHFIDKPLTTLLQNQMGLIQQYANSFSTTCQADSTCQNLLQNNEGTAIAVSDDGVKNWGQMKTGSMNWTMAIGIYFLSGQVTLSSVNSGTLLPTSTGLGSVRVRHVKDVTFMDGMIARGNFLPAKVTRSQLVGTNGHVIVVNSVVCCSPAPGHTIQWYLLQCGSDNGTQMVATTTSAPMPTSTPSYGNGTYSNRAQQFGYGAYSVFLAEWSTIQSYFDLNAEPGYLTLFVPSNAAMEKYRSAGVQYNDMTKRKKVLQRHLVPTSLDFNGLQTMDKHIYEVATANYRDLKEFIQLSIRDNSTAFISIRNTKVQVNLNEGGIWTSNGYVYPVDDVLFDNTD